MMLAILVAIIAGPDSHALRHAVGVLSIVAFVAGVAELCLLIALPHAASLSIAEACAVSLTGLLLCMVALFTSELTD